MQLMTIGYEGASIEDFLATLKAADVSVVVDIRELPISRKRGFAKTRLSEALARHDINYVHLRALGDPKPGREAARSGDFARFQRIFTKHLDSEAAQSALLQLLEIAKTQSACLLCYEREPKHCHRSIVAEQVRRKLPASIKHLGVTHGTASPDEHCKEAA